MDIMTGGACQNRLEGKAADYCRTQVSTAGYVRTGIVDRQDIDVRIRCSRISGNYIGHRKSDRVARAPIVVDYRHPRIWGGYKWSHYVAVQQAIVTVNGRNPVMTTHAETAGAC